MLSILSRYSEHINSFDILLQETRSDLSKTKIRIVLRDGSLLFLREVIIVEVLFDYSYHWQSSDGALIIRWDNAAHYPNIITHPHHKHVETESNIQPSYEQNLNQVMEYIIRQLV